MTIKEAKDIDMVSYLSIIGFEPEKVRGVNYWYNSPLRKENTPSFKINRKLNRWYDFGENKGGNLLDFLLILEGGKITDVLKKLSAHSPDAIQMTNLTQSNPRIEILGTFPVTSFILIRYYQSRRIPMDIAEKYLKEVRYKNGDRIFYALGFKNDAGGYELRSLKFKGSSSPKACSLIKNEVDSLAVFEGFFDFLSYLAIYQFQPSPQRDFLILHSAAFFEKQLTIMQTYKKVHLYLDNDATGNKYTAMSLAIDNKKFIDERSLYLPHKDLNEWIVNIGKAPNPAA